MIPKFKAAAQDTNAMWTVLESAIKQIFAKEQSKLSYEVLYRNAYNMVLNKQGETLYTNVRRLVATHLTAQAEAIARCNAGDFMDELQQQWKDFKLAITMVPPTPSTTLDHLRSNRREGRGGSVSLPSHPLTPPNHSQVVWKWVTDVRAIRGMTAYPDHIGGKSSPFVKCDCGDVAPSTKGSGALRWAVVSRKLVPPQPFAHPCNFSHPHPAITDARQDVPRVRWHSEGEGGRWD